MNSKQLAITVILLCSAIEYRVTRGSTNGGWRKQKKGFFRVNNSAPEKFSWENNTVLSYPKFVIGSGGLTLVKRSSSYTVFRKPCCCRSGRLRVAPSFPTSVPLEPFRMCVD